jgi:quinol monooxygenase YgiN
MSAHYPTDDTATAVRRDFLKTAFALSAGLALPLGIASAAPKGGRALTAVTFIHGIPGKEDDLKAHLLSLAGPTRAEPGCIRYDLYQSPTAPHEFMRYEVWESAEHLEAHKQQPHLRASFEKRQREGWTTEIIPWYRVHEEL